MHTAQRLIRSHPWEAAICAATIAVFLVIAVAPLALVMSDALRDVHQSLQALTDAVLWRRFFGTLVMCGITLLIIIPLGLAQAWLLTRTDLPARRALLMFAPFPLFLPPLVHVLSWFSLTGLQGAWAIVIVYVISFTPLVVLTAARSLEQIGREHQETMRVIGGRRLAMLDEFRQGLPGAMIGGVLALVFMLSDFAVADFLTSVGPKVTVYSDTLYAHHLGLRSAAVAAASLPGMALTLILLLWALRKRRRLGSAVGSRFEPASPIPLRAARYPLALLVSALVAVGSVLPLAALLHQAGSLETILEQARLAWPRIRFSVSAGAIAATAMVAMSLPLGMLAARFRGMRRLDALVFLPLAVPPLVYGIGLTRLLNRPGLDAVYLGMGAILIAMIGRYLAFAYLPIGGAIERIDRSLIDAARLAGGGSMSRARHIMLPLLRSPMMAAWCVSFCFSLRELDTLIMLRAGQQSLTFHLYSNVVFARQDEIAAIALLLAFITLAPFFLYLALFQRNLRFP